MHTRYIMLSPYVATKSQTHNLHMHTRYILPVRTTKGVWVISQPTYAYKIYLWAEYPNKRRKRSQPTYAYKIYHLHGRRAIYPRDSQPTYAYKIYLRRCQSGCNFPSLTTYICIQDISAFVANFKWCFELTTYICIQDISIPFSHNCNGMYHSQPTYAYKIYRRKQNDFAAARSHNLHMHTRYILDINFGYCLDVEKTLKPRLRRLYPKDIQLHPITSLTPAASPPRHRSTRRR